MRVIQWILRRLKKTKWQNCYVFWKRPWIHLAVLTEQTEWPYSTYFAIKKRRATCVEYWQMLDAERYRQCISCHQRNHVSGLSVFLSVRLCDKPQTTHCICFIHVAYILLVFDDVCVWCMAESRWLTGLLCADTRWGAASCSEDDITTPPSSSLTISPKWHKIKADTNTYCGKSRNNVTKTETWAGDGWK